MDALTIAALSMHNDMERVSLAGHNLVNVSTPGYKRVQSLQSAAQYQNLQAMQEALLQTGSTVTSALDFAAGAIATTGKAMDVAIQGDGFFVLQSPSGQLLTRRGDFHMDGNGVLVSGSGLLVLGVNGEIRLNSDVVRIDASGRVFDQDKPVDQLRLMTPADPKDLKFSGSESFTVEGALDEVSVSQYQILQGHLEGSNVNSAGEMIKLVELVKHLEANQRVMQYQDEMLGKSLGKFAEI